MINQEAATKFHGERVILALIVDAVNHRLGDYRTLVDAITHNLRGVYGVHIDQQAKIEDEGRAA
jgi:hypothetical protein